MFDFKNEPVYLTILVVGLYFTNILISGVAAKL